LLPGHYNVNSGHTAGNDKWPLSASKSLIAKMLLVCTSGKAAAASARINQKDFYGQKGRRGFHGCKIK
jgi:hypothetical protein